MQNQCRSAAQRQECRPRIAGRRPAPPDERHSAQRHEPGPRAPTASPAARQPRWNGSRHELKPKLMASTQTGLKINRVGHRKKAMCVCKSLLSFGMRWIVEKSPHFKMCLNAVFWRPLLFSPAFVVLCRETRFSDQT